MKKIIITLLAIFITTNSLFTVLADNTSTNKENKTIKVGIFPPRTNSDILIEICLNYQWETNNTIYTFDPRILSYEEIRGYGDTPLNIENYDVFIVGANYESYLQEGLDSEFQKTIKNFLSDGGGYLGVCAGAFLASQGYENPDNWYEKKVNEGVLKLTNLYLNDDYDGELQYLLKEGAWASNDVGQIPIEISVNDNTTIPIISDCNKDIFNISYGGGAGLYPADHDESELGEINPLFTYNEELIDTKPIHYWKKAFIGWVKKEKVKTDIKGQYGGIATIYNNSGRIVLYSSHPEIQVTVDGNITEYFGKNTLKIPRFVYAWKGGDKKNMSYNWWIHRRSVAWLAGVPEEDLPSCNELMVLIDKPQFRLANQFYLKNNIKSSFLTRKLVSRIGKTIIIGDITVLVYGENCEKVEFYIDGDLDHTDYSFPFKWDIDKRLFGNHELIVKGYDNFGNMVWDGSDFLFFTIG